MNTSPSRKTLAIAAAWSLAVVLGGTTVLSLATQTLANHSEQKQAISVIGIAEAAIPVIPKDASLAQAGEMLAHTCAACHGTQGRLGDEFFMPLAAMQVDQFVNTMVDFREGKRPATLMGHVARGFSDAELRAMGVYFAGVAPEKGQK